MGLRKALSILLCMGMVCTSVPVYASETGDVVSSDSVKLSENGIVSSTNAISSDIIINQEVNSSYEVEKSEFGTLDETEFSISYNRSKTKDYVLGRPMTEDEKQEQLDLMPELYNLPEVEKEGEDVTYESEERAGGNITHLSDESLMEIHSYDIRKTDSVTTPVKNQVLSGPCWAFATAAMAEGSWKKSSGVIPDISEEHITYFFHNRSNDPLSGTEGDKNVGNSPGDTYKTIGGNLQIASRYLATWSGVVNEADAPYTLGSDGLDDSLEYQSVKHLSEARFVNPTELQLKRALYESGNVIGINYHHDQRYWNVETAAYCCPEDKAINHSVAIVGWDDYYWKENFPESSNVTRDGAWIIKNSWGSGSGNEGYMYISYDDKSLSGSVAMYFEDTDKYDNNYQYDGSSVGSSVTVNPGASQSNVFYANANKGGSEILKAVGVMMGSSEVDLSIDVYTDLKDKANPTSGTKAMSTQYAHVDYAGYTTIPLVEPVDLNEESYFSIVVTNSSSEKKNFSLELEPVNSTSWLQFRVGTEREKSFYRAGTGYVWRDMYDNYISNSRASNARIKAFTVNSSKVIKPTISPTVTPEVKPSNVSNFKTKSGVGVINLSWSKVNNAKSYELSRRQGSGKWIVLKRGITGTSYKDTTASSGYVYTYRIRSVGNSLYSGYTTSSSTASKLSVPKSFTAKRSGKATKSSRVKFSFRKVSNAKEYHIRSYNTKSRKYSSAFKVKGSTLYSYNSKTKKYKKIGNVGVSGSKITGTLKGVDLRKGNKSYAVRAYTTYSGKKIYSSDSKIVTVKRR